MWPDHYPEKCPPEEAKGVSGSVYRFTNRANPKHKDFLSYYEMKPEKEWGDKACQARGLSVYTTEKDCQVALAIIPALRKKKLCVADFSENDGVVAFTPSNNNQNHKTLWSKISPRKLAEIFVPLERAEAGYA